jgi:hypothetical protein
MSFCFIKYFLIFLIMLGKKCQEKSDSLEKFTINYKQTKSEKNIEKL